MKRPWLESNGNTFPYRKLIHVASLKARIGWQSLRTDEFVDEGPYCVTGTDFHNGKVDWATAYHVNAERYDMDTNIQLASGDLLVTKDGTIGKVAVVDELETPATLNSGVFVVRPKTTDLSSDYLSWVIRSKVFDDFVAYNFSGSTINHLYQNVFETFRFPFPDLTTQRQIADFLDRETARIDLLIEKKQRLVALLGEKLSSFTERLVAFGPDAASEKVETGNTWLPVVTKGVELLPIKRVARLVNGYAFSSDELGEEGVPVIRIGDVGLSIDTQGAKKFMGLPSRDLNQFVVQRGDILIAMTGATIGKFGVYESDVRAYLNQRVGILRAKEIDRKFLSNCLGTRTFVEQMKLFAYGGAQPNIGAGEIGSILIPVPPREVQNLVADLVVVQKRSFTSTSTAVHGSIDRLKEYRSCLITAAVTGQIDVYTWGKQGNTERHLEKLEAEASE